MQSCNHTPLRVAIERRNHYGNFLIIVGIILVLYLIFRKKKTPVRYSNFPTEPEKTENNSQPRNYLKEASGIFGTQGSVEELLKINRVEAIDNLISALNRNVNVGSTMVRKRAAYALGQIGEPSTIQELKMRLNVEQADGVREAIIASISAINLAPDGNEYSQLDRRKIIEEVYKGKKRAVL